MDKRTKWEKEVEESLDTLSTAIIVLQKSVIVLQENVIEKEDL